MASVLFRGRVFPGLLTIVVFTVCLRLLYKPAIWDGEPETLGDPPVVFLNCSRDSVLCGVNKDHPFVQKHLSRTLDSLRTDLFRFLTTSEPGAALCRNQTVPAGGAGFTYDVCVAPKFKPVQHNCIAYSFGVGGDWTFDEAMSRGQFGCEVHSFDPSLGLKDHIHSPNVSFHNSGLWGSDFVDGRKWKMQKLSTVRRLLGHTERPIDMLKIDVEIGEWPFLRNVIYWEPEQLETVAQMALELHTPKDSTGTFSKEAVIEVWDYFERLTKDLGFVVYMNKLNNWCCANFVGMFPSFVEEKCCVELYLLNTRYHR